jgi:hypothetical protein
VLLCLANETYFGLDEVGTRIWTLLKDEPKLENVFEQILDEYAVPPEVLRNDLLALVARMAESGLVTIEE